MTRAIWRRYLAGSRWWLILLAAVLVADILVAIFITSLWVPYI